LGDQAVLCSECLPGDVSALEVDLDMDVPTGEVHMESARTSIPSRVRANTRARQTNKKTARRDRISHAPALAYPHHPSRNRPQADTTHAISHLPADPRLIQPHPRSLPSPIRGWATTMASKPGLHPAASVSGCARLENGSPETSRLAHSTAKHRDMSSQGTAKHHKNTPKQPKP